MIVMLDDISKAMYKKLKTESDNLIKIRSVIRYKKKEILILTEEWLWHEGQELDDQADELYVKKCKVQEELQVLERDEKIILDRIKKHVPKKTRSYRTSTGENDG